MAHLKCCASSLIFATDTHRLHDYTPTLMTVHGYTHATKLQNRILFSSLNTVQLLRPALRSPQLLRNPTLATMPPKATPPEFPVQAFPTSTDFETYLEREHATAPGLYVKLAKKNSGIPSITAAEAVEVALCYGWIDGRANACDETWWTIRYTPRRANSMWSQKNVGTVARLIETGRMRPAGLAAVDAAKTDGRWDRAYAGSAMIVVPEDLKNALALVPAAEAHWESMNKSGRYTALLKVETGTKAGRPKRIESIVQVLATGRRSSCGTTADRTARKVAKRTEKTSANAEPCVQKIAPPPHRAGLRRRKA
ncbi:hypothetical protein BKA58DRAFT_382383 [Alternaria rosae]|uniref:uncharacterized protein n=1 Tax=Alternaria rosae TaxID=1187941 RepID=UPI001E8EEBCC|nr:uncharacterized protein BKA58DRAFT_382383 [Alternaria rosae]KAH6872639.1 hypothetical protein BKA58DRAFT_382383 [Alternaria rosae]